MGSVELERSLTNDWTVYIFFPGILRVQFVMIFE